MSDLIIAGRDLSVNPQCCHMAPRHRMHYRPASYGRLFLSTEREGEPCYGETML